MQQHFRRFIAVKHYLILKSAVLALQCRLRVKLATRALNELKKEQKDVGKLKNINVKLKEEMASLRAMLAAQAKEGAASEEHKHALAEKEKQIAELEKRISLLEKELAEAKATVEKLEKDLARSQTEVAHERERVHNLEKRKTTHEVSGSPRSHRKTPSKDSEGFFRRRPSTDVQQNSSSATSFISPDILADHLARVAILEQELEEEKKLRREADGEIIRMRAAANGVKLDSEMVNDLLSPQLDNRSEESSVTGSETPTKPRYVQKLRSAR